MTNFANKYATRLAAYLDDDATSCTVESVTGDPAVPYNAIIGRKGAFPDEIVTVTNVTGTTLTITRATEAVAGVQTAYDHPVGATFTAILTAAGLAELTAGTPIASLPAVTTPAISDLFVVDQGGTTKQERWDQFQPLDLWIGPFDPRTSYGATEVGFGTANYAFGYAFQVFRPATVNRARYYAGSASSGNVDLGIYSDGTAGVRLASSGSTAMGSAWGQREVTLSSSVTLLPGRKYWATITCDNTTARFLCAGALAGQSGAGYRYQALRTSAFPLAATWDVQNATGSTPSLWIAFFYA